MPAKRTRAGARSPSKPTTPPPKQEPPAQESSHPEKQKLKPPKLETPSLTDTTLRHTYRIGRGEQGVLTFEPYKSALLPYWRFATPDIARTSSQTLHSCFKFYVDAGDFVGADMARKFLQMGMTRAARYANHAGGRKYDVVDGVKVEKERGEMSEKMKTKREASDVFRAVWLVAKEDDGYKRMREAWVEEVMGGSNGAKRARSGDGAGEAVTKKKVKVKTES